MDDLRLKMLDEMTKEIELMNSFNFYHKKTLFIWLIDNRKESTKLLNNIQFKKFRESVNDNFEDIFPLLGLIMIKLQKASKRNLDLKKSFFILQLALYVIIPEFVLERIFKYLNNEEIERFKGVEDFVKIESVCLDN